MNLEEIAGKQAHVRMDNFEASDLLTSLKRHADELGELGTGADRRARGTRH